MNLSERMLLATRVAQEENGLPDRLVAQLEVLATQLNTCQHGHDDAEDLIALLAQYDPYGDVGCFGAGANTAAIETVLRRLQSVLSPL